MKQDFITQVLGHLTIVTALVCLFFAIVGIFVFRIVEAATRNPDTAGSPHKWSWSYFINDVLGRFLAEVFLCIVVIRFSDKLLGELAAGAAAPFIAFCIGLMARWIPMLIGKLINLLKEKFGAGDQTR